MAQLVAASNNSLQRRLRQGQQEQQVEKLQQQQQQQQQQQPQFHQLNNGSPLEMALERFNSLASRENEDSVDAKTTVLNKTASSSTFANNSSNLTSPPPPPSHSDSTEFCHTGTAGTVVATAASSPQDFFQHVEIVKRPGQTLGFYICQGNGFDRPTGVFISRVQSGSFIKKCDLLHVGDEILAVNGVDVSSALLDDVVILMSVPTSLRLTIRRCGTNAIASNSIESTTEKPVVVLKSGANLEETEVDDEDEDEEEEENEYNEDDGEEQEQFLHTNSLNASNQKICATTQQQLFRGHSRAPRYFDKSKQNLDLNEVDNKKLDSYSSCASVGDYKMQRRRPRLHEQQQKQRIIDIKRIQSDQQTGDDSNDSGLSSEHSINSREPPAPILEHQTQRAVHFAVDDSQKKRGRAYSGPRPRHYDEDIALRNTSGETRPNIRSLPRSPSVSYQDSMGKDEVGLSLAQRQFTQHLFQQENETMSPSDISSQAESDLSLTPTLNGAAPFYSRRHKDYNSDSEVHQPKINHAFHCRPRLSFTSDEKDLLIESGALPTNQMRYNDRDRELLAQRDKAEADCAYLSQRLQELSLQHEAVLRQAAAATAVAAAATGQITNRQENFDFKYFDNVPYARSIQHANYSPMSTHWSINANKTGPSSSIRVMRPTDSLTRASNDNHMLNISEQCNYMPSPQVPAEKLKLKKWELLRMAKKLNKGNAFFSTSTQHSGSTLAPSLLGGFDGLLYVHIAAGAGLNSTHGAMIRDLYCVLEVNDVRKARTMISRSTECFEWNELFDLELTAARQLGFLIYQWDPQNKHRLCFCANFNLMDLMQSLRQRYLRAEKIALNLEPKGILYLEISYLEVNELYQRLPAMQPDAYFGVPLHIIVHREGGSVPFLVRMCLKEVEHRGLDVVGIYRLSGSTRCRQQLREAFDRQARDVDLSSDKVSDIHAVTGLLQDYLRALPEPLFTNSLYRMVLDAMHVSLPGEPLCATKLMLSILNCLPPSNQSTLLTLLYHLKKVVLRSEINRMNAMMLAISFGPTLLYPSPKATRDLDSNLLQHNRMAEVLKYLLDIWNVEEEENLDAYSSVQG